MKCLPDEHRVHGTLFGRDVLCRTANDRYLGQPAAQLCAHLVVRLDGEHPSRGHPATHYRRGELAGARAQVEHCTGVGGTVRPITGH